MEEIAGKDDSGTTVYRAVLSDITKRKQAEEGLLKKMAELRQFHNLTDGRELAMIELKKEINDLRKKSGNNKKYRIVE